MSNAEVVTSSTSLFDAIPPPPLAAAGALGGPVVIASLTPLRNAMSNAAKDQTSSLSRLYLHAFGGSGASLATRLRVGFTGAMVSAGPAVPQWTIIGPFFHALHSYLPTPFALLGTATLETFITFGSQTRNVQMAYNVQAPNVQAATVPLSNIVRPWGPGAPFFVLRNACGMAGIRMFSPPIQEVLTPVVPSGPREILSDMLASFATCLVSAPLNLCWSYVVTTPATWSMTSLELRETLVAFLNRQYLEHGPSGTRLSRIAARDLGVRCIYIACVFSMFSGIERLALAYWPWRSWRSISISHDG